MTHYVPLLEFTHYPTDFGTSPIDILVPGSETFRARMFGPIGGPNLTAEWFVDGILQETQSLANGEWTIFEYAPPNPFLVFSSHTIELKVTDMSPMIHDSQRHRITDVVRWYVRAVSCNPFSDICDL